MQEKIKAYISVQYRELLQNRHNLTILSIIVFLSSMTRYEPNSVLSQKGWDVLKEIFTLRIMLFSILLIPVTYVMASWKYWLQRKVSPTAFRPKYGAVLAMTSFAKVAIIYNFTAFLTLKTGLIIFSPNEANDLSNDIIIILFFLWLLTICFEFFFIHFRAKKEMDILLKVIFLCLCVFLFKDF